MASFIVSFSSANLIESAYLANLQPDDLAIAIGSNGSDVFQLGVVLVFAQIGVVGLA
jgi:hypothetical protein